MWCLPWLTRFHTSIFVFSIVVLFTGCGGGGGGGGTPGSSNTPFDESFGSNGYVVQEDITAGCFVALNASDKILISSPSHILRLNEDGSPDVSFGTNGRIQAGSYCSYGSSLAIDGSGRILVTGKKTGEDNPAYQNMIIWRFNADGTPDNSFGTNGYVEYTGEPYSEGKSIILDTAGNMLVLGTSSKETIWRYHADGTPDMDFGGNGMVRSEYGPDTYGEFYESIIVDTDGRIIIVGGRGMTSGREFMILRRFLGDGTPDAAFGDNGIVMHGGHIAGQDAAWGESVVQDASKSLLVVGYSHDPSIHEDIMIIWRLNENGSLDTTFGSQGWVVNESCCGGNAADQNRSMILDNNGKILVTGRSSWRLSHNSDMVIWRYHTDGSIDMTFGVNGVAEHNSAAGGNSWDYGNSIILDPAERILVAGTSTNTSLGYCMTIWRYCP